MFLPIAELLSCYRNDLPAFSSRRPLSVTEATNQYLDRINKDTTNAFITICKEKALDAALSLDKTIKNGIPENKPLFGIPIAIKDNIATKDIKTTCASKILDNYYPPYHATAVQKLIDAGAIIIGKTNMDEFGMGGSNENSAYGPVRHPLDPLRVPGGSSGGSAVAVANKLCAAALGSDTGGSVRLPASYCGIVGFKPSYGAISRYGLIAYASSLDQIGILAQNITDTTLLYNTIRGKDEFDSTSVATPKVELNQTHKPKIGLPKEYLVEGISNSVRKQLNTVVELLKNNGYEIKEISLPHTPLAIPAYYIIAMAEAASNLSRYDGIRYGDLLRGREVSLDEFYREARSFFGKEVERRILMGTFALSSGYYDAYYLKACQIRRLIQNDFLDAFKEVDTIISPVAPTVAYKFGEKGNPLEMYLNDIFTVPVNLAGLPALSLPIWPGLPEDNYLPTGLQIIGKPFDENTLLNMGRQIERLFESRMEMISS